MISASSRKYSANRAGANVPTMRPAHVASVTEGMRPATRNVEEGTGFGGRLLGAEGELIGALYDEERLVVTVVDVLRGTDDPRL